MAEDNSARTVTIIPPVPVKYGWRVPSLSRRGGVRVHWISDGAMPLPEERGMQFRDKVGNKLRDVVDPTTGFCIGVVSPIMGGRLNQGTSGSPTTEIRRGLVENVGNGIYLDENGRVVRTESMGDSILPTLHRSANRDTGTQPPKKSRNGAPRGKSGRSVDMRDVPGGTGRDGGITRADVLAYIKAMSKGRPVNVTPELMKIARKALEGKRAEAARAMSK